MKNILHPFLVLFLFGLPAFATNTSICDRLEKDFADSKAHPGDRKRFKKLLATLNKAVKKEYTIKDVLVKVDAIRFCEQQKEDHDTLEYDANLVYVRDSRFPEGRDFTQSKAFQLTLDGARAALFSDEGSGEDPITPPLKVSKLKGKPIFWSTDYRCVSVAKNGNMHSAAFILNDYAKARFYELTKKERGKKISVAVCASRPREIRVSAPIDSGRIVIEKLSAAEVQCLSADPECK
jgi:hypothetical protein